MSRVHQALVNASVTAVVYWRQQGTHRASAPSGPVNAGRATGEVSLALSRLEPAWQTLTGLLMEYAEIAALRERHSGWRLLRAGNAALVLSFLGHFFVEQNNGATAAGVLASALDDELYALNAADPEQPRYPRPASEYLEEWAHPDAGWLRRFYPLGSDEVHYDATPSFEKAYAWVTGLQSRAFVGTESRLHTVVDLLRQIVHGA
jgi:hypothetical protein